MSGLIPRNFNAIGLGGVACTSGEGVPKVRVSTEAENHHLGMYMGLWFSRAAIRKRHNWEAHSDRNLPAHSSGGRSLRPRCRQSCAPSEARREDSSSLLVMCWQPLASFGLQLGNSTLCLHHPPALSRSVSSQGHLLIRTPVILDWHPTPILLPGKSHGRRSLVGCSPWCH